MPLTIRGLPRRLAEDAWWLDGPATRPGLIQRSAFGAHSLALRDAAERRPAGGRRPAATAPCCFFLPKVLRGELDEGQEGQRPPSRPAVERGRARVDGGGGETGTPSIDPTPPASPPIRSRLILLALLVLLADLLFWHHPAPGLAFPLFTFAVFAAATLDLRPKRLPGPTALLLLLGALPALDHAQPLSLAFLAAALALSLAWARHSDSTFAELPEATLGLAARLPARWTLCLRAPARHRPTRPLARDWALPVLGAITFTALLAAANPVLADLLAPPSDPAGLVLRVLFWAAMALGLAPFLDRDPPEPLTLPLPEARLPGLNPGSVRRALWLFNLVIGVQTGLDASILLGGAALPEGMTYASYAHRGAYPLLATALLAGGFALAARPFLEAQPGLRPLLLLWLAQTIALSAAAFLRLDLYVGVYGLTWLRLYALIWIALTAAGLALTLWQVARAKPNRWLFTRAAALLLATFYALGFVNLAGVIAERNLALSRPDYAYLCSLGPMASAAAARAAVEDPEAKGRLAFCLTAPIPTDWRGWSLRAWRVRRTLAALPPVEAGPGWQLLPGPRQGI